MIKLDYTQGNGWNEGFSAAFDGKEVTDCPYQIDTEAAYDWVAGWERGHHHLVWDE
jgi:ribosome modulation factor